MRQGLADRGQQSTALAVELGFLADHGHEPEALRQATILARIAGVPADEFVLKHGLIGETEFYRALAAELGLPFLAAPRLSPHVRYPDGILAGLAPLAGAGAGFVAAPHGAALAHLLKARSPGRLLAITTPSQLREAVFRVQAPLIAHRAAHDLAEKAPALATDVGYGQIVTLFMGLSLFSFGVGYAPGFTIAFLGTALSPLFLGMVVLRLSAPFLPERAVADAQRPRMEDADLPVYTVIAALYREKRVAARLLEALSRLDYPAAKLDIKLVLEADDEETPEALRAAGLPGNVEVLVAPPGQPRTKPRALNVALPLARGSLTVIYDAEDVPDPGQLRLAAAHLLQAPPQVACLQARLTIDNTDDSWLTRLFTIEYAALFDVFNPGLAAIGSPVPLGGTSNHFRTAILREVHGWDAWNVTEDADLGIRLARLGYAVKDLPSSTLEEAPGTLRLWMRQRTRWMKGFVQTATTHSREPWTALRQLGAFKFFSALVLTWGIVLSALVYPLFTGLFLGAWLFGTNQASGSRWDAALQASALILFLSGAASILVPACVALHRRRLWRLAPWLPLLPLYYGLVSLAAWGGLWELATATFRWNKTSHGLARTSRSGLVRSTMPGRPAPDR
ncbi:cellulose synthase/poly-beta-1,6-N-acetylglucosamine synthase-like glycosyltransferase [Microvirga flocculans]|uniref:Cellulose synthase/poly-beta-1,6-N-acetylglucosamine synthase-like glycosyltransferase n=1 Tax=Microvirga flocculans TaxID=217168 RepID=A0A7W6IIR9_9HYPH|nr:glycosyltransferase family 2 protein [Microvirga flocculans]MBB4042114.1 cellulose synthase/poly-beta-1,6-N-acetylglucosamine synthase-like glycosyltransferase [Microvirga flocculans]